MFPVSTYHNKIILLQKIFICNFFAIFADNFNLIFSINEYQIISILRRNVAHRLGYDVLQPDFKFKPGRYVERLRRGTDRAEH